MKHDESEIKTKEVELKKTDKDYQKNQGAYTALTANLAKLKVGHCVTNDRVSSKVVK